jgi:hypothetical protein
MGSLGKRSPSFRPLAKLLAKLGFTFCTDDNNDFSFVRRRYLVRLDWLLAQCGLAKKVGCYADRKVETGQQPIFLLR